MKKPLLIALTGLVISTPAYAQNAEALCTLMKQAKSSAAYTPGVDVNGNTVAPADLNAPVPATMDIIRIPMTVDLAQSYKGVLPPGTELASVVGVVEIHSDGKVVYNGADLSQASVALCNAPKPKQSVEDAARAAAEASAERDRARVRAVPQPSPQPVEAAPVEQVVEEPVPAPQPEPVPAPQPEPAPAPAPEAVAPQPAPAPEAEGVAIDEGISVEEAPVVDPSQVPSAPPAEDIPPMIEPAQQQPADITADPNAAPAMPQLEDPNAVIWGDQ